MVVKDSVVQRLPESPVSPEGERPFWEIITELSTELSDDEWKEQPADGAMNYRYYLYGQSRRDPQEHATEYALKDEAA